MASSFDSNKVEVKHFKGQSYYSLYRSHHDKLFDDEFFPPTDKSIYKGVSRDEFRTGDMSKKSKFEETIEKCKWKRLKEITKSPEFVVKGFDRDDIQQGIIGDCWF